MSIDPNKFPLFRLWRLNLQIFLIVLVGLLFPFFEVNEGEVKANFEGNILLLKKRPTKPPLILQKNSVFVLTSHLNSEKKPDRKLVIVTGYSSTKDQCDKNPFITAYGSSVKEGIVAANFLPFGTKIKIPEIYGEKTFVVKDRMHPRKIYQVDIWFPTRQRALNFGAKRTYIEF